MSKIPSGKQRDEVRGRPTGAHDEARLRGVARRRTAQESALNRPQRPLFLSLARRVRKKFWPPHGPLRSFLALDPLCSARRRRRALCRLPALPRALRSPLVDARRDARAPRPRERSRFPAGSRPAAAGLSRLGHFFETLKSARRLALCQQANVHVARLLTDDPFANLACLRDFDLYAADGHWHGAAAHAVPLDGAKRATGHVFALNLRTQALGHLTRAQGKKSTTCTRSNASNSPPCATTPPPAAKCSMPTTAPPSTTASGKSGSKAAGSISFRSRRKRWTCRHPPKPARSDRPEQRGDHGRRTRRDRRRHRPAADPLCPSRHRRRI